MIDHNRDWALRLAEAGLAVFPAGPDKKARVKWRDASTTDPQTIAAWWAQWPESLPAIDLAKCGLIVLDGDRHGGPDGRAALKRLLLAQHGEYNGSATPAALTPGDGAHVYFRQNGHAFGNCRGELPDGIDVRGDGGYVICPYATLPDGRRYRIVDGMADLIGAFKSGTIPPIPPGIAKLLEKPARKEPLPEQQTGSTSRSTSTSIPRRSLCRSGARRDCCGAGELSARRAQQQAECRWFPHGHHDRPRLDRPG